MLEPFELPFMQRAALEIALLAPLAGILGAQIVLRRLAFYTHAVGTAAFPGLVVAGPAGVPAAVAALGTAGLFAPAVKGLSRAGRVGGDAATAIALVAALAAGIVLASDVFESGSEVDQLLFGSLLAIGGTELAVTAIALATGLGCAAVWRRRWLAVGFDSAAAPSLGMAGGGAEMGLLGAVAVAAIAALDAVGALLVAAILVVPAATARLVTGSVRSLELAAGALALAEGLAGLLIAYELDVPPGAAIATLGGAVFAAVAVLRAAASRRVAERPA